MAVHGAAEPDADGTGLVLVEDFGQSGFDLLPDA
jgi:hypothetical protein